MARVNRKKRERRFTRKMQIKLLAIFAFILLCLTIVLLRIVYINIHSGHGYAKKVLSQENYDSQTLISRRGEIVDTNGRLLAYSEKVYNLVIDCSAINKAQKDNTDKEFSYVTCTAKALSEVFDLDMGEIENRITGEKTSDSQYQKLLPTYDKNYEMDRYYVTQDQKDAYSEYLSLSEEKKLSDDQKRALQHVTGVWFEEEYVRHYPLDSVASTVIGFANAEGHGACGLESYYDSQLVGTNGRVFGYLNSAQEYERRTIPPVNGNKIQTALDVNIQESVERCIKEFDEKYGDDHDDGTAKHGAKNIGVIVMDPNDGSILAMATNTGYNLNDPANLRDWYTESEENSMTNEEYEAAINKLWYNFCVSDGIEPGSTFKPITIASALECGAITPNDYFYCDGGEFIIDTEIHCDVYPYSHGDESLGDALKNSCNDALMQIGMKMHVPKFIEYQSLFNFGKLTGIDLPNEATGCVYNQEKMNAVELATCTFGQGITVTMVQEMAAFCAVVNGGYYYQPHVVDKILNEDGKVVKDSSKLLLKQTVSEDVSALLREYLELVVKEGTGSGAQVPGYRIGGKTGTAEKFNEEHTARAKGKYLVSFIGAVPIDNPQVVMYVVVDEPNVPDQAHSTYAQEIFQNVAYDILPYMEIYPTEEISDAELADLGLTKEDVSTEETVVTFMAFDSYGNLYNGARVEDGKVVTSSGAEIAGAYIETDGTVFDGYGNAVSKVVIQRTRDEIDPKADNPNIVLPPTENGIDPDQTTVWDGAVTEE